MFDLIANILSPKKKRLENANNQPIVNNSNNNNNNNKNSNVDNSQSNDQLVDNDHISQKTDQYLIKILLLGGCGVGKSSILRRYLQECFTKAYIKTVGVDLSSMMIEQTVGNGGVCCKRAYVHPTSHHHCQSSAHPHYRKFLVNFLDVPYAEIHGAHIPTLLREVSAIVMVFDSTSDASILAIDEWKSVINQYPIFAENRFKIPIALFSNKSDLGRPVISQSELEYYSQKCEYNLCRFTSPKNGSGIRDGIDQLITLALDISNKEITSMRISKAILYKQQLQQQQQQQQTPQHKKQSTKSKISSSLPNIQIKSPISDKQMQLDREKEKETVQINEILERANTSYNRIQLDLEDLMKKSHGTKRYNDLIKLERQRGNEHVSYLNSLKKLIQPNFPHTNRNKLTKEVIYNTLEENIKKWNTLIQNLQMEYSLKLSSSLMNATISSMINSSGSIHGNSASNSLRISSPSIKSSPRNSIQPPKLNQSKLGFGFKNNAKTVSMATSLFNPTSTYNNIDTDNPVTHSSSITTSSPNSYTFSSSLNDSNNSLPSSASNSTTVSPAQSPIGSPENSLSISPSILPSSYNLNITAILPESLIAGGKD